jgi:hypothetical protein
MSDIFGQAEPPRDEALATLLGDVVGAPPFGDVDWTALASRIASARARQRTAWWSYAARWERRAVPMALAAGLAGILVLWGLGMPTVPVAIASTVADPVAALVEGIPAVDAARSYAGSVTDAAYPSAVELY